MTKQDIASNRRTIALSDSVIVKLKNLAKSSNLKMYELASAAVDLMDKDDVVLKRAVEIANQAAEESKREKSNLVKKVKELPPNLQEKLSSLSADELEKLLNKAGK